MLSLPPAFVLSQDQTLKFNVPLPRERRDPVTRLLCPAWPDLHRARPNFELATAEAFAPMVQTPAAAGVSLSKQTMHRTHDPEAETLGKPGTVWVEEPFVAITRDVFGTPRSPWEPRLYGGAFRVSNRKLQTSYGGSGRAGRTVEPIVASGKISGTIINM